MRFPFVPAKIGAAPIMTAALLSSLALCSVSARAQTLVLDNGGVFIAARPAAGSTLVNITGTYTNTGNAPANGITIVYPYIAGTSDFLFGGFYSDFSTFAFSNTMNVPGASYSGILFNITVDSTSVLGLYNRNLENNGPSRFFVGDVSAPFAVNVVASLPPTGGVPEPSSFVVAGVFAAGLTGLVIRRRRLS